MTKRELIELLTGIPDDANVFIETVYRDTPELAEEILVTGDKFSPGFEENMKWFIKSGSSDIKNVLIRG